MKNLYRIALLFILLLAPVFIIGQNHHWNIALNFHTAMELSHQSESAGINEKYRNKSQTGNSSGFGLSIIRRIKAPWYVGVEIGRLNARYKLHLDRDFGDLNRIIGFSEPTIEGDYQNIDQIEYNNIYYRWAVCSYYYLNDNPEQTVQTYLGLGYEQRHLNKSDSQATYRDFTNYVFLSEE